MDESPADISPVKLELLEIGGVEVNQDFYKVQGNDRGLIEWLVSFKA